MKCDRSAHLDLAAFLAGEDSPETRNFRDHYPTCPDCSAEVRAWMQLHTELDPPPQPKQHPTEELLLQFESQPERMSAVARTSVETHLKACPSCRDELQALRGFDFSLLDRPAADPSSGEVRKAPGRLAWLKGFLATPRAVLAHPAFAYGLVLLLILPQLSSLLLQPSRYGPVAPQIAEERQIAPAPPPEAESAFRAERTEPQHIDEVRRRLADESAPRVAEEMPVAQDSVRANRPSAPSAAKKVEERLASVAPREETHSGEGADRQEDKDASESLRPLGYVARFADGGIGAAAAPPSRQLTIEMDPSGRNNIPMSGMLAGATLRIKPQQPVALGSDVAIRIKSADGRRELREIHTVSRADGSLEMKVPPGWMPDGLYSLEVLPLGVHPEKSRLGHDHDH